LLSSFCFRLTACRDIKPANVLVHSSGAVKISDFGMSKAHLKDVAASSVGTLYYMSPERCLSNDYSFNAGIAPGYLVFESSQPNAHNRFADIWSLGCCVYELAYGRHPFAPAPGAPAHLRYFFCHVCACI
jgi:serine/threonine protein kinase